MSFAIKRFRKPIAGIVLAILAVFGYRFIEERIDPVPQGIAFGNVRIEAVQVDIATRIAGRLWDVVLQGGDLVYVDQEIAYIDSVQLQAQLLRARAEVASAESQIAGAQASLSIQL